MAVDEDDLATVKIRIYLTNMISHCCPVNFFEKQVNYMNLN